MSRRCDVTGAEPSFGNAVSHSHRRTRRRWNPNLQSHRYWLPSEGRWVRLTLTAKALKTVDRKGIEKVVAEMRARGVKL
ncbi:MULTISPECIES: 50S ribosomal protein L28 [unclassified Micromonospora]|uniref:50S ribosomal protein L28 n=1 Tax=Micromonospora TaxID=1873 RepID=UPI001C2359DD|nr:MULTISPECIES: 50S ribosomal protein L28 [unclassified Micromonospora]MBU8861549.1 50S ribosomal protein L28 [Micromonospora sp. WMMB482]MDG4799998.1 50S ribosomal protein L28 [Micromonospora sp. WMMD980]MDM4781117.1 50S ribosomal protein L28 [Micromonospora sp. b486]WFE30962.1 50S ribosomal protein L28 [Micromonospora sp. WMMD975]